jgi:DNA-directed RNA polymerase specialized sigma24 family protein
VTGSRRDDASAFCAAIYGRLVGGLALYVADRAVAEELAQEALLRTFARWDHVRALDTPEAWTWRIAMNLATSTFRRRSAERRARRRLEPIAEGRDEDQTDGSL